MRSAHQGSELADRLRALGLDPVLIPAIEFVEPSSFAELDAALAHLAGFDWLVFTSANAVGVFAQRWLARTSAAMAGISAEIAAIGPATGRALETAGLKPNLVPPQAIAESLADALLPYARRADGQTTRLLLVRAEDARQYLPDTLRAAGAEVTIAPAYRTRVPQGSVALLRELLSVPEAVAAITFTSSSTARNLVALCEAAEVVLPQSALRVSIGPITSHTLRELGLPPHAEAPEATVDSLAEAVARVLDPAFQTLPHGGA